MNAKRWVAIGIAGFLVLVSVGFQTLFSVINSNFTEAFDSAAGTSFMNEEIIEDGDMMKRIAVLHVEGTIQDTGEESSLLGSATYNHNTFLERLEAAGQDDTVGGVIIEVNSPGGGVVESAEIHDKVVEIQEEYGKPVYISMANTAASGGYYLAASANKIVAHPATLTGSIGVIMSTVNYAELADKIGIKQEVIKSAEHKDIMSATRDMTDEERAILQSIIDDMYADFVQVIVDGRGMSESKVRELGDGRVYSGKQALDNGLVDDLGDLEDTIAMMKEEQGLKGAEVFEYTGDGFGMGSFWATAAEGLFVSDADLLGIKELMGKSNSPEAMYLYAE
ncbi:signal peptide peptidase SppA [Terribacillus sp. DMT04]|uniref:signal peptide peptidase SppA n=1 Tax=Terribacillus sp. DMT04 TaxID=2850441 RepID=UPI001C2C4F80|nr:signal peptide peptidase SppA [Terribacillus sp. DMT04]QXE00913.1 signal peptide peptidase SppA [Terribacillus sp. DMT04]